MSAYKSSLTYRIDTITLTFMNNLFGEKLREVLIGAGQTQCSLARQLKMSRAYVGQITHGERLPAPKCIRSICETLELPDETKIALNRAAAIDRGYEL